MFLMFKIKHVYFKIQSKGRSYIIDSTAVVNTIVLPSLVFITQLNKLIEAYGSIIVFRTFTIKHNYVVKLRIIQKMKLTYKNPKCKTQ